MTNDRQEVKILPRRVRNIEKRKQRHVVRLMVYEDVLTFRSPDACPTLRRRRSARHLASSIPTCSVEFRIHRGPHLRHAVSRPRSEALTYLNNARPFGHSAVLLHTLHTLSHTFRSSSSSSNTFHNGIRSTSHCS